MGVSFVPHTSRMSPDVLAKTKFTILCVLLKLIWIKHFYSGIAHFSAYLGLDSFPSHPTLLWTAQTRQLLSPYAQDVLCSVAAINKFFLVITVKTRWAEQFSKKIFPTKNEMFRENREEFCILKKITFLKINFLKHDFSLNILFFFGNVFFGFRLKLPEKQFCVLLQLNTERLGHKGKAIPLFERFKVTGKESKPR